jgi:hypothetical protein
MSSDCGCYPRFGCGYGCCIDSYSSSNGRLGEALIETAISRGDRNADRKNIIEVEARVSAEPDVPIEEIIKGNLGVSYDV